MMEMENKLCFVCVESLVAGEWKVPQLFDGSLSDFEGVAECSDLEQYVQDGRVYCAVLFLQFSELSTCCKLGSSEHRLPTVKLLVVQIRVGL